MTIGIVGLTTLLIFCIINFPEQIIGFIGVIILIWIVSVILLRIYEWCYELLDN